MVCLIQNATGGVGHVTVQPAAAIGATVIRTAGTEDKRSRSLAFGADAAFNYS